MAANWIPCWTFIKGTCMTRTFIAIEMDASQQELLAQIILHGKQLLPDLRWVNPTSIHLTLVFLGELDVTRLKLASAGAEEAANQSKSFTYRMRGLDVFGPQHTPRILWMG